MLKLTECERVSKVLVVFKPVNVPTDCFYGLSVRTCSRTSIRVAREEIKDLQENVGE